MKSGNRTWAILQLMTVLILTFGSAGWVLLGYMSSIQVLAGMETSAGSEEIAAVHFDEARRLSWLTAIWLFSVLFVWSFLGARRMLLPTRHEKERSR